MRYCIRIFVEGMRKTMKTSIMIVGFHTDIWAHGNLNMKHSATHHSISCCYRIWRFITLFTKAHTWTLVKASLIYSLHNSWGSIQIQSGINLSSGLSLWGFFIKILYTFVTPTMHATGPTQQLITKIINK
jgi:hypothetical protein